MSRIQKIVIDADMIPVEGYVCLVTNHTVHKIKCGKNWGWLTGLDKEGNCDV